MAGVAFVVIGKYQPEVETLAALQQVAAFTGGPLGDALTEFVKAEQAGVMDRARAADG